jgi:general secretion pathway protein D
VRVRTIVLGLAGILLLWAVAAKAEARKSPAPNAPAASAAPGATRVTPGGATEKVPEKQLITMDFQDVEIGVLVKFISEITGKNFILDEKVRGKVTVISPTKISIDEAYRVFQSILEVKGFTTLPAGPVIKIVPVREAKESGAPLAPRAATGDQYITQLVPLTFIDASTLVSVLQPMVSKDGLISAYDAANTLVLIDTASNIERLLSIISELDIEMPERGIEMVHLQNAYAETVAKTLEQVLQAQGERAGPKGGAAPAPAAKPGQPAGAAGAAGAGAFKVIPDERTNSIIALASPSQMRMIKKLIKDLDKHLEGVSKIHVYALKYANATAMVQVLSDLVGGGGGAGGRGGAGAGGLANTRRSTRQQQQQQQQQSFLSRTPGSRFGGTTGQPLGGTAGGTGGAPGQGGPTSAVGGGGEFVGEVRITADPFTNSVIISAGPQDYDVLKRVIGEIDIPRRQVYVEAIIFEISLDKSLQLGFEYQGGTQLTQGALGLARLNFTNLNQIVTTPQTLQGLVMAAVSNQTVTLPDGTVVPAQVALFTALQNDRDVNVLSAPNILTSDNQEAEILVGQNVPFIASRATDTTNLANTFATVDRQDVGITLRLTPQISQGDVVRLDLYEEVSAIIPNPLVDANVAGPTTTVRSASTTVTARTGHTVVIGGLVSDDATSTQSKLPFIAEIPVLGNLFKQNDDRRSKINLLIFLTPHVVHDDAELQALSIGERDQFKRYLRQEKMGPRHYEQLNEPSWNTATATPTGGAPPIVAPGTAGAPSAAPPAPAIRAEPLGVPTPQEQAAVAPRPLAPPAPPAPIVPSSPSALGIPSTGHRFAVLLSVFEKGNAPPELQSTNGFVTVYMPIEAGEFFVKGGAYEYKSPTYEARYTCLEVFPDAATALSVYPEGQPLERWGGTMVRWRPISAEQMRAMIAGASPWKRTR